MKLCHPLRSVCLFSHIEISSPELRSAPLTSLAFSSCLVKRSDSDESVVIHTVRPGCDKRVSYH